MLAWCHSNSVTIGYTLNFFFCLCPTFFESVIYGTSCVGRYAVVLCFYCGGLALVLCFHGVTAWLALWIRIQSYADRHMWILGLRTLKQRIGLGWWQSYRSPWVAVRETALCAHRLVCATPCVYTPLRVHQLAFLCYGSHFSQTAQPHLHR